MRLSKMILSAAVASATLFAAFAADAQQAKPEDLLKMRQGLKQAVRMQFGPLGAFAQGKGDLPADADARAENLVALMKILPSAWAPGTENLPNAKTKAPAFTSPEFKQGWQELGTGFAALKQATASNNPDAIKAAVANVGKTCKACHDNFHE